MKALWLWVFLAGGTGALLRHAVAGVVDRALESRLPFPGVLAVNLIGCLLIGLFSATLEDTTVRAAVMTGLLGGFTTYSAFALLTLELLRDGRWGAFAVQVLVHVLGGLLCAAFGLWLGRAIAS